MNFNSAYRCSEIEKHWTHNNLFSLTHSEMKQPIIKWLDIQKLGHQKVTY